MKYHLTFLLPTIDVGIMYHTMISPPVVDVIINLPAPVGFSQLNPHPAVRENPLNRVTYVAHERSGTEWEWDVMGWNGI